jgi:hypothetical protein
MKALLVLICLLCAMPAATALGHSTAGLKKQALKTKNLSVDHMAFYLERAVGKRRDEAGRRGRFYIDDFLRIEQRDGLARVHANIRDQKTADLTKEVFLLQKNADDSWNHVTENGEVISAQIYHYVKPGPSLVAKITKISFSAALAVILLVSLGRKALSRRKPGAEKV